MLFSDAVMRTDEREAIGSVVIEASRVEDLVEHACWALMDVDGEQGLRITGPALRIGGKLELFERLLGYCSPAALRDFGPLGREIHFAISGGDAALHANRSFPEGASLGDYLRLVGDPDDRVIGAFADFNRAHVPAMGALALKAVARRYSVAHDGLVAFIGRHRAAFT